MTRTYSVIADNITLVAAPVTIVSLRPNATVPIEVFEVRLGFSTNATSAMQRVHLMTQVVGGAPVLTGVLPTPVNLGNTQASSIVSGTSQAAGTAGVDATTESSGAKTVKVADAFNHLTGWVWVAPPDGGIILPAGSGSAFALFLPSTPATLTGWNATVTFRELA